MLIISFIFFLFTGFFAASASRNVRDIGYQHKELLEMKKLLFPNQTAEFHHNDPNRRLQSVPCTVCQGLTTCTVLNGYQIQETYYPNNLNFLQTCKVIDDLGSRLEPLIFGEGRTFRDTEQCREIAMQYLCLFYGSDNLMYVNECVNQEDVKDPNPANHKVAPRPPCRSFCVQSCYDIKCPPVEDQCTPDPIIAGETLAANLGCGIPYYDDPYFNSASRTHLSIYRLLGTLSVAIAISMYIIGH